MQTNLVGQYVQDGWIENRVYHEIVAVSIDRDELHLWARNPDGLINRYVASGTVTCNAIPGNNTSFQCHTCQCWSATRVEAEECCS